MPSSVAVEPAARVQGWRVWLHVWKIHRWLGLGLGALIVLMSATGSLLVVHHELERVLERDRHVAAPGGPAAPLAPIVDELIRRAPPGYRLYRFHPAAATDATHRFLFLAPDGKTRWTAFVVPANGRMVWSGPDQALFTPWLLGLHMQLRAGRSGYVVTMVAGIGLLLLGLTGIYVHRDRWRGLARHPFRWRLGWRVALGDLHKWVGLAAIYFPVVLGLTGAIYSWRIFTSAPPTASSAPPPSAERFAPLEPMLAAAQAQFPDAELTRLQFPTRAGAPASVLLLHRRHPPWQKFSRVDFDTATGALRSVRAAKEAPALEQFKSLLAPLHFGFHGATWVKWAYFFGGLTPGILALSGGALWWMRRRGKRAT
ncbi:MAG: hypothetical protein C0518_02210 [Opitutus sp.]|nr:hypothetical protein [Opitutus sp.]